MRILIIDDEKNIRTTLKACLEGLGHEVAEAANADSALAAMRRQPFDAAFLDLRLGETSGLTCSRPSWPRTPPAT
jgi:NtrC-family two-component system response regulator AlgB